MSAAQKRKQCIVLDVLCGSPPPLVLFLSFSSLYFILCILCMVSNLYICLQMDKNRPGVSVKPFDIPIVPLMTQGFANNGPGFSHSSSSVAGISSGMSGMALNGSSQPNQAGQGQGHYGQPNQAGQGQGQYGQPSQTGQNQYGQPNSTGQGQYGQPNQASAGYSPVNLGVGGYSPLGQGQHSQLNQTGQGQGQYNQGQSGQSGQGQYNQSGQAQYSPSGAGPVWTAQPGSWSLPTDKPSIWCLLIIQSVHASSGNAGWAAFRRVPNLP